MSGGFSCSPSLKCSCLSSKGLSGCLGLSGFISSGRTGLIDKSISSGIFKLSLISLTASAISFVFFAISSVFFLISPVFLAISPVFFAVSPVFLAVSPVFFEISFTAFTIFSKASLTALSEPPPPSTGGLLSSFDSSISPLPCGLSSGIFSFVQTPSFLLS
ncbi:hypothetical protein bthur0003_64210 [Bacillus thuringiensis serovar thuringiensis str. T01001]|nr:hypothetical protein bthur0003_64210 [Bacillus thuringiensis serovar thuringiensis str. T01001]